MENRIKDMNCQEIKKDPISLIKYKVNDFIKLDIMNMAPIYEEIFKDKINKLAVILSIIERLKDHKSNMPLRPIVLKGSEPNYFLEKVYVPFLK